MPSRRLVLFHNRTICSIRSAGWRCGEGSREPRISFARGRGVPRDMATNAPGKAVKEDDAHNQVPAERIERITVALIPKAAGDLQRLQDRTSLSKTDIVNRAISLYEFFECLLHAGKDLIIRDPDTRETQLVKLL